MKIINGVRYLDDRENLFCISYRMGTTKEDCNTTCICGTHCECGLGCPAHLNEMEVKEGEK